MMALLSSITMTDLTQGIAGPYCSQMAADLGADVIKVEPPAGDRTRRWGPPFIKGESAVFLSLNRNKRSLGLDLSTSEGKEIVKRLISRSDVLIEEFLGNEASALGLSYEGNQIINPRLIQCNITGFGERGPMAEIPGAELPVQAMLDYPGGLGAIGDLPVRAGPDLAGTSTAVSALQAIVAALFFLKRSGIGQRVSVSMAGVLAELITHIIAAPSDPDEWGGHLDSWTNPRDHGYQCKDGLVWFSIRDRRGRKAKDMDYTRMLRELGMDEAIVDPRFANNGQNAIGNGIYAQEVKPLWENAFKNKSAEEVVELLREHGAEAFLITDYRTIMEHPQTEELNIVREVPHPRGGTFRTLGNPITFSSDVERSYDLPPPELGSHTDKILKELGYTIKEIEFFRKKGVVI